MSSKVKSIIFVVVCLVLVGVVALIVMVKKDRAKTDTNNLDSLKQVTEKKSATLTFIGHASVKLKTSEGKVIYIDPYYQPGDYSEPADYILVTHEHNDHNLVSLCEKKEGCREYHASDVLVDGEDISGYMS